MTKERASITDDIDLSNFAPEPRPQGPSPEAVKAVSDAMNFPSRQAAASSAPAPQQRPRRYLSGRTAQVHLKTKPEFQQLFLELCDKAGVEKQVEGFEQAILAWQREIEGRK